MVILAACVGGGWLESGINFIVVIWYIKLGVRFNIIILAMEKEFSGANSADAEAQFNANFVRSKQRRKCIYVQDTQSFVDNLKTFMKADFIE